MTSFFAIATQAWAEAPTVTIDPVDPGTVTATEAEFTGTVNPNGLQNFNPPVEPPGTAWRFEYSRDGGATWTPTVIRSAGMGTTPVAIAATPDTLSPNSDYEVRIWAENQDGITLSPSVSFHTDRTAPLIRPLSADQKTATSALLRAQLNPAGEATNYYFEYGTDASYGSRTPEASAGEGVDPVVASQVAAGLQPSTTYHFRVVAKNGSGTSQGADGTFTTAAAGGCPNEAIRAEQQWAGNLPECRAYEQVSPVQKNGLGVTIYDFQSNQVSARDGGHLEYTAPGAFPGAPSSLFYTSYLANREAGGWSSFSISPPEISPEGSFLRPNSVLAVSADGSHSLVVSSMPLAPGAVEGNYNVFVRDNTTGTSVLVASWAYETELIKGLGLIGGDDDFSQVIFTSVEALTPDAPVNGESKLYEFSEGAGLRLASIMPDGTPAQGGTFLRTVARPNLGHLISANGSRVFFSVGEWHCPSGSQWGCEGLYMREGNRTIPISVSQRAGEKGQVKQALFADATPDGSVVYFTSMAPLTEDAWTGAPGNGYGSLYRYDVETGELQDLTVTDNPENSFGPNVNVALAYPIASPDGSTVYFEAAGKLTADATAGLPNLYAWHQGRLHLVLTGSNFGSARIPSQLRISPNGMQAAIQTTGEVKGQEPASCPSDSVLHRPAGPCSRVYEYDLETEELSCASCPQSASGTWGHAYLGAVGSNAVTNAGQVFFQTPARLNSADTNDQRDVYEWSEGRQLLISTGKASTPSLFLASSPDGKDVYFTTEQHLVPQDTDNAADAYDARVDGGLPAQMVGPEAGSCTGEECQPPIGAAKAPPVTASAEYQGPPNQKPAKKKPHKKKHHKAKKKHHKAKKHTKHHKGKADKRVRGNAGSGK